MDPLSCDQARRLLSDMLTGALAAGDADQLDVHLAQCDACREQARAACRLDRALGELVGAAHLAEIEAGIQAALAAETMPAAVLPPRRRSLLRLRWLMAASVLLVAVGTAVWLTRPAHAPAIGRLEMIEGDVYVVTGGTKEIAAVGREVRSGQGLQTVGEESGAVLVYADATRLEIGPDSTLGELSDDPLRTGTGKRVSLLAGFLGADVTKQPDSRPMVLTTPHAEVVVRGTKLSVVNSPEATRVDLQKGSVHLTRRSDGQSVELSAGTFSIARAQTEPLGPQPLAAQYTQPRANLPVAPKRIWTLAFSPDGRTLLTGGDNGQVRLWDPTRSAEQAPVILGEEVRDEIRVFAFSRDGRLLAAGSDNPPLTQVWDWNTRAPRASLPGHRTWIEALAFSKDAQTLVVAGAHGRESAQIHLWDLKRRQVRAVLDGHAKGVWCVTFSPDGQTLASAGRDGVIKLWDFARAEIRQQWTGHTSEIYALAFSPDGTKLVSSSRDKTVKLWDAATGQELHCLLGHSKEVRACAFAPDGRTVASGSQDATVRLWRVADGQELATFKLPGSAFAVAYSPDGRTLAAGGWYKTVQLWDLPLGE
jgi:WD40 repeat protein